MTATYQQLLSESFLRAVFDKEFQQFLNSASDQELIKRLEAWSSKHFQKETSAESAFINVFFEEVWGYTQSGKHKAGSGYTCFPKYPISGAGQSGGTGEADLALGQFDLSEVPPIPQVLCEFKDVRSNLDAPQKRKGNNRSPVKQCADYLREAMKPLFGNEAIQPTWGIVTDMNEFRLYWRNTMPAQYQRFILKKATTDEGVSLLEASEAGGFQRFLFAKLLHSDSLLTTGGASPLLKLLKDQRFHEKEIETTFYREYRAYRERLIDLLIKSNPKFSGTKGRLVRLAQKLIDRCIFVMFCEDMGEQLSFPPNALRDYLAELSKSTTFEPGENDAWNKLKELFQAMNEGKKFRSRPINRFNGGLFASDVELESLAIPNEAFCSKLQGENEQTLENDKLSLLYFAGSYNFGTVKRDGKAITLFTLGRIFEQSITELEALEAKVDEKESLTVLSKRKRDGVYYTPEWVVERVVAETLAPRLDEIRTSFGWSLELEGDEAALKTQLALSPSKRSAEFVKHAAAVKNFRERLNSFTVLDPACGSGAFLIHTLEYLLRERRRVERELTMVSDSKGVELFEFKTDDAVRSILSANIFGVDINPASVEIARLALWLHTARSDQPLSNLDANVVTGNSLIGSEVYAFKKDLLSATDEKREAINAFDFGKVFPAIFDTKRPDGPGFDCIVGNPPYVKLQNFKKVYPESADYLRNAKIPGGAPLYESCQTGNFDLYLPFIEHGLTLLNNRGRLGYIAPSVWRFNEYGDSLRQLIKKKGALERWIDFGSHQVFNEATTYTALQFYSKGGATRIQIALAPDGVLADIPDWDDPEWKLDYKSLPDREPWVFASQTVVKLMDKLRKRGTRLSDPKISESISQGLISGAFETFALTRLGANRYRSRADREGSEVIIEDAITRPLISAQEIDRYIVYKPSLSIIFPYELKSGKPVLIDQSKMQTIYPKAWKYLLANEADLRKRDGGQFSIEGDQKDSWYAFSRNQNLDKQSRAKIVIAGTGTKIEAAIDADGSFATNDKRVYSVFTKNVDDLKFLCGFLNSRLCTFFFKQIARPKDGGYFDIETQFLGPLPRAFGRANQRADVLSQVDALIEAHNAYANCTSEISHRLTACTLDEKSESWLWTGRVGTQIELEKRGPQELKGRAIKAWAKAKRKFQIAAELESLGERIRSGARLTPSLNSGELRVMDRATPIVDKVFVEKAQSDMALVAWRQFLRLHQSPDAETLANGLRCIYTTDNKVLTEQLVDFDKQALALEDRIHTLERVLDETIYGLFDLTANERAIVERHS